MANNNIESLIINSNGVRELSQPIPSGVQVQKIKRNVLQVLKGMLYSIVTLLITGFIFFFMLYLVPQIQELGMNEQGSLINNQDFQSEKKYIKHLGILKKDIQKLNQKINSLTPGQPYIVINTTKNRFFLYKNKKVVREGFCSSGSYTLLMTEEAQKWIFKTPKGKFWIQGKTTSPVWRRPDWSFVEEGLPIPSPNDPSRWEYGVLGDYALSIGDGYLIHGTIYKRFLGMPVTHGCIRLNDEDLKAIYNTLDFGSKVFIY